IQSDPELPGISALIFDEFHERSLAADLGLALALETRAVLRPDLMLLAMSATLDAAPVATLMADEHGDAPVITAEGRAYPVDIIWPKAPLPAKARLEPAVADLICQAASQSTGGILAFLPGEGEIRRVERALAGRLPPDCVVMPLFGALAAAAQRAAITPLATGRKVVLATSIAETSLTIPDITNVVDAGRARRSLFDPGSGMSRLVTTRVSHAEATQRAGRAGRVKAGKCYRLWTKGEDGALASHPAPEIAAGDLAALALELAIWGADDLPFLTPPPPAALAEARKLLTALGALNANGKITPHGRVLAAMPLHPRLAHMLAIAGKQATPLAALLGERDPLPGAGSDLALRLDIIAGRAPVPSGSAPVLSRIRTEAKRLTRGLKNGANLSPAAMLALAYPDRIGQHRPGLAPRFVLSGGKGAKLRDHDPLAAAPYIVVASADGDPTEAQIRLAARLDESELRTLFAAQITQTQDCTWSRRDGRVLAQKHERFGALKLTSQPWPDAPPETIARAMLSGVRQLGLSLGPKAERLRKRAVLARQAGADIPDMSLPALMDNIEDWLLPHLTGIRSAAAWKQFNPEPALRAALDWGQMQALERVAPGQFTTPMGRSIAIDYDTDMPQIDLRLQEMFGTSRHPSVAGQPLRVTLLSPAGRPLQVTTDLPRFWVGEYLEVRKEMRGRYPKHYWPENPAEAQPTLKVRSKMGQK
ncbi:MAG: ATP-dependent helicase HrpB, partial [Rhodobacteraceae bacterium]|nr:ATP-dependent helicase HrpB [Paracoccaceae bacterium]